MRPSTAETRERIRRAALEVFSERGFDGAATRDIALRAGCTQPLLNYHFASKEALWRSSVDLVFGRLDEALAGGGAGSVDGPDAAGRARELVRQFVRFSARNPQLHRIITQECKVESPRMDWLVERHIRPYFETAAGLLAALAESGAVPAVPPAHLYYLLTGAAATMFVLGPECRRLTGLDPAADEVIETHADAVCRLLLGPESPTPAPD